ncbi:MAG: hypothetical protein Q7S40_00195 [Opitutaceae bacterium]|nr:hypothetical protein [Opitutaceae bacterium]
MKLIDLSPPRVHGAPAFSNDPKQWLELDHILLARDVEIVVVESVANLDALPDSFIFAGFPLNFAGRDGSPIRAVAIRES